MRNYRCNSPQAAARLVALALTADGHVSSCEDRALMRLDVGRELGLAPGEFDAVLRTLCEDLAASSASTHTPLGHLDARMLDTLIDEITDPALRRKVMRLCLAVTAADDYLADGEVELLGAMFDRWRIGVPTMHA